MTPLRTVAIIFIFCCTVAAWAILGGTVVYRTEKSKDTTTRAVGQLWGTEQRQKAPVFYFKSVREVGTATGTENVNDTGETVTTEYDERGKLITSKKVAADVVYVEPISSDLRAKLSLDYRQKGLMWFSTYVVDFTANYRLRNDTEQRRTFYVGYNFPAANALYDNFQFKIRDKEIDFPGDISAGIQGSVDLDPGETVDVTIGYRSPGLDRWSYSFGEGVARVKNFTLVMDTDFDDVDFPAECISPTAKEKTPRGWRLTWKYADLLTGYAIGVEMPKKLNPGPIASRMSFFAPVSLLFFFAVLFIVNAVQADKRPPLHPMNFFFLAAALFSFHLLFAYLADHINIHLTFAISSGVSCLLVFIYVALARGPKYALGYATFPQIMFLVLFSYTFFYPGYTGLMITIGAIITLAVLMVVTAKVDWSKKFGKTSK